MHSRMLPALLTLLIICSILTAFYFQIPGQAQPIISFPERGEISYGSISSGYAPWTPKEDCVPAFIDLANKYGGTYESIGKSSSPNNWDIIMFKFGNPNGAPIMIDAQLHGNEYYGYETLYALATWLLTSNDATARHILQNNYVLMVPVVDYRWARTNYNSPTWMTAYDPSVDGEHCGVNLNRNFDPGWSSSLSRSNSDSYSGTAPNSEKESQALINAWNTYHPRIYWNLHQGAGPMTMCSATTSQATADANKVRSILPSIQSSLGVSRGWSFSVRGNGNSGMAIDAAAKAGIAGLLTEVMSGWDSSSTKRTDLTSGNTFKQVKAMCQAVESTTTPAPTPTPNPTPSPSSTPTPAPSPTPTSTPNARLTVSIGAGNGTTTPSEGTHTYNQGQEVTITAFPASTHFFSRWIIDGESFWREPTINVTMNSDHDAEALFYRPQLTMVPSPNGTTSPSGDTIYNANTQVTLTATPNNGYRFDYWIIDYDWIIDYETYETSNPFKLTMIDSVQVTPVFTSNDESPPQ
jgi:predicted deacylase